MTHSGFRGSPILPSTLNSLGALKIPGRRRGFGRAVPNGAAGSGSAGLSFGCARHSTAIRKTANVMASTIQPDCRYHVHDRPWPFADLQATYRPISGSVRFKNYVSSSGTKAEIC